MDIYIDYLQQTLPYLKERMQTQEIKSTHTIQQLQKAFTRALPYCENMQNDEEAAQLCVALNQAIEELGNRALKLQEEDPTDIQSVATELVRLSRERKNTEFNKQFRERSSIILANLERASIQDIVMSLSAISWRLSLLLPGSRSLRISNVLQEFVS